MIDMKRLLNFLVLILSALPSLGATTTIGQLPLLDPSSTNAYWEVEDQSATPRSRKVPIGTVPQLTVYGVPGGSNYIGGTLDIGTNINVRPIGANGTNGTYSILYHPSFTVANLFTPPASSFPVVYCSDAVTTRGTGAYVRWDGANWLTWENVPATNSVLSWIFSAKQAALIANSSIGGVYSVPHQISATALPGRLTFQNGAGASPNGGSGSSPYGSFAAYTTGTSGAGNSGAYYIVSPGIGSGDWATWGASYFVGSLCTSAQKYWTKQGFSGAADATLPASGAFFMYDMFGINQATLASLNYTNVATTSSNNWIAVTGKAGVYSANDTGLPVSTSVPAALMVICTSTNVFFYTNGVLSVTVSDGTRIPTAALYHGVVSIAQTLGGTSQNIREYYPYWNYRHAAYTF